jgi:hypothetical protein
MTTDKARKRAVRSRMTKTGESYAAARRNVVKEPPPAPTAARTQAEAPGSQPPTAEPLPGDVKPGVSDESMVRATGKGWDDWFRILDERGLDGYSHPATAAWIASEHGIDGWWAQQITVGFERVRGLRRVHQTSDGFEVSVSKTFPHDVHQLWTAFADDAARGAWQDPPVLSKRTAVEDKSIRFDHADDGSRVIVLLTPKSPAKTTATLTHERMAGPDDVEKMRAFWRAQLKSLEARLGADAVSSVP